jgi:hypothetical protein
MTLISTTETLCPTFNGCTGRLQNFLVEGIGWRLCKLSLQMKIHNMTLMVRSGDGNACALFSFWVPLGELTFRSVCYN